MTQPGAGSQPPEHFSDRVAALVTERRSQVVLGLDPDPAALWPAAVGSSSEVADPRATAAEAVAEHCRLAIEAAGPACVAVKLQLACFERLGAPGWAALEQAAAAARGAGLLVIADGKRGDVPVTAAAYAQALFGATPSPWGDIPGLGADAATANPLLGDDALAPLVTGAQESGAGLFVLVRTSNPGAAVVQDVPEAEPLHDRLAALVGGLGETGACGLSSVGAVTGATRPDLVARLRELMPRAIFLLPGIGAQGGKAEDLAPAWAPHPAAGLVTASRSIVGAGPEGARDAAEALRETAWNVAGNRN